MVTALTSHQCGPGSTSSLLVLVLALRGFSSGTPVFPSPQKPTLETLPNIRAVEKRKRTKTPTETLAKQAIHQGTNNTGLLQ